MNVGPSIRMDNQQIRGWRNEFRCWWRMAKYVDVVFDSSGQGPGSTSICRACCQILETRTCTGETEKTANGCQFHQDNPNVPFAVTSTVTSARLRDMIRPSIFMRFYFLKPGKRNTDLMNLSWVKQIRNDNDETSKTRKLYQHGDTCFFSPDPQSIVQGRGLEGIYWKQCDGRYMNAIGVELHLDEIMSERPADATEKNVEVPSDEKKAAELAWRRHHPDAEDEEDPETPKRKHRCIIM